MKRNYEECIYNRGEQCLIFTEKVCLKRNCTFFKTCGQEQKVTHTRRVDLRRKVGGR